jgi:hypothetical protein
MVAMALFPFLWGVWGHAGFTARFAVRWLSHHTGVPALVVAAIMVVLGWRVLKRTMRFAVEVTLVAVALFAMTELGWIRW